MPLLRKRIKFHIPAFPQGLRRALGLLSLVAGITGCILPILPGLPFLVIGARLLGPRDPALRRVTLIGHTLLRRLNGARHPFLRATGVRLMPHWRRLNRMVIG
jgi:hypothetical protein